MNIGSGMQSSTWILATVRVVSYVVWAGRAPKTGRERSRFACTVIFWCWKTTTLTTTTTTSNSRRRRRRCRSRFATDMLWCWKTTTLTTTTTTTTTTPVVAAAAAAAAEAAATIPSITRRRHKQQQFRHSCELRPTRGCSAIILVLHKYDTHVDQKKSTQHTTNVNIVLRSISISHRRRDRRLLR